MEKLKIHFAVQHPDGRTLNFEDEVETPGLRDWFDRVSQGIRMVFEPMGPVIIECVEPGAMKINAIKQVRAVANIGLKEAKEVVEGLINLRMVSSDAMIKLERELTGTGCRFELVSPTNLSKSFVDARS